MVLALETCVVKKARPRSVISTESRACPGERDAIKMTDI